MTTITAAQLLCWTETLLQHRIPEIDDYHGFTVSVTPIPANIWINVEYKLPENCDKAVFELTNMIGVKVLTAALDGNESSISIDIRNLPVGVYFYTVNCEGSVKTGKIIVAK